MARVKESTKDLEKELNIDKKELVNEIRSEIKSTLDDDIKRKVDYEARIKLDKIERKIYRQKIWAIIRRDILILLLLAFAIYEAKILYDNNLFFGLNTNKENEAIEEKDKEKEETKETEEKEEVVKDTEWYLTNHGYLLENIKTNLDGEDKYYLYNTIEAKDIKNSVKLNMAYQLINVEPVDGIIRLKSDDLKKKYNTLFIDEYQAENFTDRCMNFIYNSDSNTYMAIYINCDSNNTEIFKKVINAYEENENIVFELKVGILNEANSELTNMNGEVVESENQLNTYKFSFKDNYLEKIVKE